MPFALIIAGLVMLVSGVRGTTTQLASLVDGDLTGTDNFLYWVTAILVVGAFGYIDDLRTLSRTILFLLIVVLFLKRGNSNGIGGGFFAQFTSAINSPASTSTR